MSRVQRWFAWWPPQLPYRVRHRLRLFTAGGRWSVNLAGHTRRSLRWLLLDGLFANISDSIINTYQSVYLLALGASRAEIGLLGSLANLAMPLAMLPGARLAARSRQYKWAVLVPTLAARLLILGLIFFPFVTASYRLIYIGIALVVARAFLVQLFNPAWTALVGNLVPTQWRGRYFSTRNMFMGGAGFLVLLGVGPLIDRLGKPLGYQWALGVALVAGLAATYCFARIEEAPRVIPPPQRGQQRAFWRGLKTQPRFLAFCAVASLWNFAQQIAGPFFIIFLADEVRASASLVGLSSAAASLAALPGQRIFGGLNDRKGARWVQRLTGFAIPWVPVFWVFMTHPWQAFPIQVLSGFMWAGYNLAAFNLLLELTPDAERPAYVAFYQALVGIGMAGGAAFGAWLAQTQGYAQVFLGSGGLRLLAALIFAVVVAGGRTLTLPRLPRPPRITFRRRNPLAKTRRRVKEESKQDGE